MSSDIQPHFPAHDPLHLLDDFLNSLSPIVAATAKETQHSSLSAAIPDASATFLSNPPPEERHEKILRVAEFLFGNRGSLLESALGVLDEQIRFRDIGAVGPAEEKCLENGVKKRIPPIKILRARKSGRKAAFVFSRRAPLKTDRDSGGSETTEKKKIKGQFYLCLLGRDRCVIRGSEGKAARDPQRLRRKGMHCTCRSFFERVKASSPTDSVAVCKHLLAAILAPHLLPGGRDGVESIVDDRDFAKLVTRASVG